MKNSPNIPDGYLKHKVWVEIGRIDPRPASLTRAALDPAYVADYAEDFDNAPAVLVVAGPGDKHFLADGVHRFAAAKKLGLKGIDCHVKQGSYIDALQTAMEVNEDRDGLPLTRADRMHWLDEALKHPEMSNWSDPRLAEFCGLARSTVFERRKKVVSVEPTETTFRNTSDGKVRPATQKADPRSTSQKHAEIEAILRQHPDWSIGAVARHCDVTRPLVRKVREKIGLGPSEARGGRPAGVKARANGEPAGTPLLPPETRSQVATVATSDEPGSSEDVPETGPDEDQLPTIGNSTPVAGPETGPAANGRVLPALSLDARWDADSRVIWDLFGAWPEANRGFFVLNLRSLTNVMIRQCPNTIDRSGEPLVKKG